MWNLSSDPYGKDPFGDDLVSGKLRWLLLILVLANIGSLISMALDTKEPILHFPVRLQGTVVWWVMSFSLLVVSSLAIMNWVSWLKRHK